MKKINHSELDKQRWDTLITLKNPDAIFSLSWYMDAISDNWYVFVDEEFSKGIALATKKKGIFSTVFTPNFSRYSQFIGDFSKEDYNSLLKEIEKFSNASISFDKRFLNLKFGEKVFQKSSGFQLQPSTSSQAIRAKKKAISLNYSIKNDWNSPLFYQLLDSELGERDAQYLLKNLFPLKKLIEKATEEKKLVIFGIYLEQQFLGACLGIQTESTLLYLKGICSEEAKKNGAMHFLFDHIQAHCRQNGLSLDFGGSNIPGIRQFFMCYGGEDVVYYTFQKSNLAIKILKRMNQWIKKK
jgi:hypothetical protein